MSEIQKESLKFEKIIPTSDQVNSLYQLLIDRKHSISHKIIPSYEEHNEFVYNNPYLVWYLIYKKDIMIGSFYIQSDNSIGINLNILREDDLIKIFDYIKKKYEPLPSIKSVRRGNFFLNIPCDNYSLIKILHKIKKNKFKHLF